MKPSFKPSVGPQMCAQELNWVEFEPANLCKISSTILKIGELGVFVYFMAYPPDEAYS